MKLKYKVRQLEHGENAKKWAVWANKKEYFSTSIFDTESEAIKASLLREGLELVRKLDDVQARMEQLGMIDPKDPQGWRACI